MNDITVVQIDREHLRQMLNAINRELSLPFFERRARSEAHRGNLMEEFSDAIGELTQRERELKAAVGIANLLIDNNEVLHKLSETRGQKLSKKKEKLRDLEEELTHLKKSYSEKRIRQEEESEQKISSLTKQNETLNKRILHMEQSPITYEFEQPLIEDTHLEFTNNLKHSVSELKSSLTAQKKSNKEIKNQLKEALQELSLLKQNLSEIKNKYTIIENKCKNYSERIKELEVHNEQLARINEDYKENLDRLNKRNKTIETLKESFLEKFVRAEIHEDPCEIDINSLSTELEENFGMRDSLKLVEIQKPVEIIPTYQRKSPGEEYFQLVTLIQTTQALKINSKYMDKICTLPTQELYQEALRQEIPFHMWHNWIESQLNQAYIYSLYRKQLKKASMKQKVCPV